MKKMLLMCAAVAATGQLSAQKTGVTIAGKLPAIFNDAYVYLIKGEGSKSQTLDSAKTEKGAFKLSYALEDTAQITLTVRKKLENKMYYGSRTMYLMPGDKISITAKDTADRNVFQKATVKGGALNAQETALQTALQDVHVKIDSFRAENMRLMQQLQSGELKMDSAAMAARGKQGSELYEEKTAIQNKFIDAHPDYYVSLVTFRELLGRRVADVAAAEKRFNLFTPALRTSTTGLGITSLLNASAKLSVNQPAPDFASQTPDGKMLKLSDLKGKYVLLDFWASWCGPCRAENPNVVKAYNTYKDKNFTVMGVSLDREGAHDKWTEAIEKDQLTWYHVSDLKWWKADAAKLYMISSIPQNFLIDPNGRIIAQNLRGEALQQALAKLLQ